MFNSITEHLISSACHSPWSHRELSSTNQGWAVHAATTATAAAHALGKVGNIHPRVVGDSLSPKEWKCGKDRLPTYEENQCVRGEGCCSPPGDQLAPLQSVNTLTFPHLFSRIHCSAFQSNSRCPYMGQRPWKFQQQQEIEYAQCKDMWADVILAWYSTVGWRPIFSGLIRI